MILVNVNGMTSDDILVGSHAIPTIHLAGASRDTLRTYVQTAGAGATASLSLLNLTYAAEAPLMAKFSSRGPLLGDVDLLKPDVTGEFCMWCAECAMFSRTVLRGYSRSKGRFHH